MRVLLATVCVGVFCTSVVVAKPSATDKYQAAAQLAADDDNEKALAAIEEGLAIAPKDLQLLGLKGVVLLKLRDYTGALAAYQAYLDAGARGANRREAQKIVDNLRAVKSTFIDITLASGAADIYLDSKTQGVFCRAAPVCKKALLPGDYKVIVDEAGYERFTKRVVVANGKTAKLEVALVDKPSLVTVRVAQPGARITIDDKPYEQPIALAGGKYAVVVALAGHATVRLEAIAHAGKPVELAVELVPLVAVTTTPRDAELLLDDKPITAEDGGLAIPVGAHVLIARAKGFHDHRVEIPAQRPADYKLALELPPIGALLELADAPRGARVVVDGKTLGTAPLAQPVEIAPGMRSIEIRVDGYRPYRTSATFATDQHVRLELGKLRRDSRKRTYLAAAATGTLLVAGIAFSVAALDRESAFEDRARRAGVTADDPQLASMKSDGERYSLFADLGFGLGIAGIAVTTYFFLREGRGESAGNLRFGVGPTGAMASGRF